MTPQKPSTDRIDALSRRVTQLHDSMHARFAKLEANLGAVAQLRYCGVWSADVKYFVGNFCTFNGSVWHANADSQGVRPGTSPETWTLAVKHGKDGRDAR